MSDHDNAGTSRGDPTLTADISHHASSEQLTVFYDGACPRCREDRRRYTRLAAGNAQQVCWFDITGQESALKQRGIDPQRALTELHVEDEHGQIHAELDAYRLLMERVTLLRPLAWLIGLPLIRPLLSRGYHYLVMRRLKRSGRL